jgi:hypothetical protein
MLARLKGDMKQAKAAIVVDGKLILSFPQAITPIVWQMDLADAKSSSFEVVQEDGVHALVTKKQGAQKKDVIAPFQTREDAVTALMATSEALASGHGHLRSDNFSNAAQTPVHTIVSPAYSHPAPAKKGGVMKWIGAILILAVLLGLISAMASLRPRIPSSVDNAAGFGGASNTASTADPATSAGVPVSADDFLRSR